MGELRYLNSAARIYHAAQDPWLMAFHELKILGKTDIISSLEVAALEICDPQELLTVTRDTYELTDQEARAAAEMCLLAVCKPKDHVEWVRYGQA